MAKIPSTVSERLLAAVPKFKKVLIQAKERDVNESDTVTIITDMLEEIFGFDKYSEITREYAIQGTYCDLAIKCGETVDYLIEVKAIGIALNNNHLKQAVNYASREGIEYVVLTNGLIWEVHRISLEGKVKNEQIFSFNFEQIDHKKIKDQELLFMLCKKGVQRNAISDFYEHKQSVNKYNIGALVLSEPVVSVIKRELRRLKDGLKVESEEIIKVLEHDVIRREMLETESAKEAKKHIAKIFKRQEKAKERQKIKKGDSPENSPAQPNDIRPSEVATNDDE